MDKKDKLILYELDKNSRQSLSNISKKVKLSRESVLYRLRKYLKDGLIRDYLAVIDMSKLGFTHYKIYLKLHNITETQEKEIIESLCNNPFISWVASCDGEYSLIFAIKARSILELNEHMKRIRNSYWQFIKEQDISIIVRGQYFYRDYLVEKKGATERVIDWGGAPENIKLDIKHELILEEISKFSRISAVEIAKKLKISPDSVIRRIKQLEEWKIIQHYLIWPNVNKLIGNYYKVLISLNNLNQEKENKLIEYCQQNPYVVYSVSTFGRWQYEIDVEVKDIRHFRELIRDFLNKFSDIVSDYTALNIFEEYKYRFFEREIFTDRFKKQIKPST